MINLSRALQYTFRGDNAITRTIVGALLMLLAPLMFVTGLALLGYQVRIVRDDRETLASVWSLPGRSRGPGDPGRATGPDRGFDVPRVRLPSGT